MYDQICTLNVLFVVEATLKCENLLEITDAKELVTVLWQKCIKYIGGHHGHQIAERPMKKEHRRPHFGYLQVDTNASMKIGKLKVAWPLCLLGIYQPPETCFTCFESRQKS